jgi:cytochrome P450
MNTATEAARKAEFSWVSAASGSRPSLAQLVCAGGALLVVLTFTAQRHRSTASDGAKPPATPRKIHSLGTKIPLIGDLLLFTRNAHRKHDFFTEMCLRFNGEPWQGHIIGMPTFVHFTDPRAIEEITTTQFDNFAKGLFQLDVVRDLLGNSIAASDGERWYHQRKTAMKFFSARTLRDCMQHTMKRNMKLMITAIDKQRDANQLVDLSLLFHQFTLQTFAETGLGVEIPLIGQQEANAFEQALDTAMPIMSRRGRLPPFV